MEHLREVTASGFRIRLDLSQQVLRLGIPERDLSDHDSDLHPTLPRSASEFVSAAALTLKAKQFDDGLYAAVELAAQNGAGNFPGKVFLLTTLASRLAEDANSGSSLRIIGAAGRLGGLNLPLPQTLNDEIAIAAADFLSNELRSKPIAFYTWSRALESIFRQDRMLQTPIEGGEVAALVKVLQEDEKLRSTYVSYLELISRLTNPLVGQDLRSYLSGDPWPDEASIFPPSRSHETDLVMKLYGGREIPEGFNLMEELIARIRSGDLPLQPETRSGWYDYQIWSIEPLARPEKAAEAPRLRLNQQYREHLLQLFKGIYALTRETHVKQLSMVAAGMALGGPEPEPSIDIRPDLSAEPLATFYLRRALSYRFIRDVLHATFGTEALKSVHRLTATGATKINLGEELADMETLFYGAHATVSHQLGLDADTSFALGSGKGAQADGQRFEQWRSDLRNDADVAQDARMMVPVFHDIGRNKTKVWVFLGWQEKPLHVSFETPPRVVSAEARLLRRFSGKPKIEFVSDSHALATPAMAEVYVTRILNRKEFRKHCDRYRTHSAILENLA